MNVLTEVVEKYVDNLKALYTNTFEKVRVYDKLPNRSWTEIILCQVSPISPFLFNFAIDDIVVKLFKVSRTEVGDVNSIDQDAVGQLR